MTLLKRAADHSDSIESPESDYLYIAESQLPNAGKGLFTAIEIYKDEVISLFKGEILTERQINFRVKNNTDQYFMEMHNGSILDSRTVKCFAKYANDGQGYTLSNFKNNSKIALDDNDAICLIATRKIKEGEEIFCSYGKRYWNKHKSN